MIEAGNSEKADSLVAQASKPEEPGKKKRGSYSVYTPAEKAKIGSYAMQHGVSASLQHFKTLFPDLKWSTVNAWKVAILKEKKRLKDDYLPLKELPGNKMGRPATLDDELKAELKSYILAVRDAGGTGMLKQKNPSLLECNGGHVLLIKSWAKYFLSKINFVKRKATTSKAKTIMVNFDDLKTIFFDEYFIGCIV
jgi:hypothetical protein